MCDTLVDVDPRTGELRPAIAQSWTVSDRGGRLTLRLRDGVRFHTGRELTASDVVFTLTRLASESFASRSADLLEPVFGFAELHGDVATDDDRFTSRLAGVRASGQRAVEISLAEPYADFVRALAHPATAPLPREAVERHPDGFARRPVCAGPYAMAEPWDGDGPIRLRRFEDHAPTNEAYTRGGAGYADEIVLRTFPDAGAAFDADGLDVAPVPRTKVEGASGRVVGGRTPLLELVGLPVGVEPFDRPEVRRALSLALDRERIAALHSDEPATGFLPFGGDGCGADAPAGPDAERARRALADAGIDLAGETIRFRFNRGGANRRRAEAVAASWEEAFGTRVELTPMGWEAYRERGTGRTGFDAPFRFSWMPPYPSADRMLRPLFHSGGIGRDNWTRYASRDFQEIVTDAREASAAADREDAHERAEALVCNELPMLPVAWDVKHLRLSDRVDSATGLFVGIGFGDPLLRELFVTPRG